MEDNNQPIGMRSEGFLILTFLFLKMFNRLFIHVNKNTHSSARFDSSGSFPVELKLKKVWAFSLRAILWKELVFLHFYSIQKVYLPFLLEFLGCSGLWAEPGARIIFPDPSMRTLSALNPITNPGFFDSGFRDFYGIQNIFQGWWNPPNSRSRIFDFKNNQFSRKFNVIR